jgi:hypothetical protein
MELAANTQSATFAIFRRRVAWPRKILPNLTPEKPFVGKFTRRFHPPILGRPLESADYRSGRCGSIRESDGHSGENGQMVAAKAGGEPRLGSMGGEVG